MAGGAVHLFLCHRPLGSCQAVHGNRGITLGQRPYRSRTTTLQKSLKIANKGGGLVGVAKECMEAMCLAKRQSPASGLNDIETRQSVAKYGGLAEIPG